MQPSHLAKSSLAYAKLVATPTETSWSQAYNAGNLFVCLSLSLAESREDISLQLVGKEIFNILESEFFTLEEKNLDSIKQAIHVSTQNIPEEVSTNLCLSFFKDSILYLFIAGHGRVIIKRHNKIGSLLEAKEEQENILTASGYLENDDTIVLETKQFAEDITDETLASALELALPNDIAEALSPQIHGKEGAGQAAIIIVYHGGTPTPSEEEERGEDDEATLPNKHEQLVDDEEGDEEEDDKEPRKFSLPKLPRLPAFSLSPKLTNSKKIFLGIFAILLILLVGGIFFTKQKQADSQQHATFLSVYTPALKKYDEGKALMTLNKNLSHEDFLQAQKLLTDNQAKFKPGTPEDKQIQDLLQKVNAELTTTSDTHSSTAKEASVDANSLLSIEKANSSGLGFTQDADAIYFVTDSAVESVDKASGKKKTLIKNNNDWTNAVGLATYQGNMYVLDQKKGVLKFVAGSDGYGKSSYFKNSPDLSQARAIAIDSSVWILQSDGTVLKYTRGESDGYKTPTLDKPMANPTKISTEKDMTNVYILDRGNARIVKVAKDGSSHTEYNASIIKDAKDFEINEKDKKALVLSGDKIWEIPL